MANRYQKFLNRKSKQYNAKWLKEGQLLYSDFRYVRKIVKTFAEIRAFNI
jgi:hypothetical protein